jgi:phosphoribosylaminoimidazole-succinocarboxamide synthase
MQNPPFLFSKDQTFYAGKVRDVYRIGDFIVIIASDRISAFDHILGKSIPYKGQVLNQLAAWFLTRTSHLVPNWLDCVPFSNVSIGKNCKPILVEMVVRGHLAGHAAREYALGKRVLCGVSLPDGLTEGQAFEHPIITPTTKASSGHDEDISREEIWTRGLVEKDIYLKMESYALDLFAEGQRMAKEKGLILVDTKYEFGLFHDQILLMDEVHTPDSSRYYIAEGYEERLKNGQKQIQLSKEFVREWLIENGFSGKEGQIMPELPDEFVRQISERYIELFERMTGEKFVPAQEIDSSKVITDFVRQYLKDKNKTI